MKTYSPLHLAEILTSRLCHDLITPVGAINTGLELFAETPADHLTDAKEILTLISHSAHTASARLSFFRAAFGKSGDALTLGDAKGLVESYLIRSKLISQWDTPFRKELSLKGWGRVLLNTILWMADCAPRGGTVHISFSETPQRLSFRLKADPLLLHQGTLETLKERPALEDLTPRTTPCYLIHLLLEEKKGQLTVSQNSPSELLLEVREGEG